MLSNDGEEGNIRAEIEKCGKTGGNSSPFELTKPLTHIMVMHVLYTLGFFKSPKAN